MNYTQTIDNLISHNIKISLIVGPPGTGKSTYALNKIKELVDSGIPIESIALMAYNRWIGADLRKRAAALLGLPEDDFTYIKTVHAMALGCLHRHHHSQGIKLVMPLTDGWKRKLKSLHPWFRLYEDHQLRDIDPVDVLNYWRESYFDDPASLLRVVNNFASKNVLDIYQRFKATHNLCDFTDMQLRAHGLGTPLPVQHMFADEAQDLSDLQIALIAQWASSCKTLTFIGDADQAINGFRPGVNDADFLIALNKHPGVTTSVLNQSYRVPRAVHSVANKVIHFVKDRIEAPYKSTEHEGQVIKRPLGFCGELCRRFLSGQGGSGQQPSIAILLRVNDSYHEHVTMLDKLNLIYDNRCRIVGSSDVLVSGDFSHDFGAIKTAVSLSRGDLAPYTAIHSMLDISVSEKCAAGFERWKDKQLAAGRNPDLPYSLDELSTYFQARFLVKRIRKDPFTVSEGIPPWRQYYIKQHYEDLLNKETFNNPIQILTVHASKGLEFTHVLVDMRGTQRREGLLDPTELRLHYVAYTRARQTLVILTDVKTPDYIDLKALGL